MTDTSPDLTPGDQPRRSVFLVAIVVLANLYLVGFGLDASLSTVEEVFRNATGSNALLSIRSVVAIAVFFATLLMIFILIFVPHLPRRIFIPLTLFVLWAGFGIYPFSLAYTYSVASFAIAALQLTLAFAVFFYLRRRTGHFFLAARRLPRKQKLILRTVVATLFAAATMPIAAVALLLFAFVTLFEAQTGGYMDFTLSGVDMQEKIMTRDSKTVHLVAMVHIGDPNYYREFVDGFSADALVISEGITDTTGRLTSDLSYRRAVQALGLQQQPDFQVELALRALKNEEEQPEGTPNSEGNVMLNQASVINADVDVSDFEDITIQFLSDVGQLYDGTSLSNVLENIQAISGDYSEDDYATVMHDIVTIRNDRAISELDSSLAEYNTIILPWGALHMPGMETELIARGFEPAESKTRRIAQYSTILAQFLN